MGPIEVLWISLGLVFGIVGYSRGISKELGVTLPVLVGMYILLKFGRFIVEALNRALHLIGLGGFIATPNEYLVIWNLYVLFMLFVVLISYEGVTLDYPQISAPPPFTDLVDFLWGLVNGYLVIGTIWYYLDSFSYPIQRIGLYQPPLDQLAQTLVRLLPLNILPKDTAEWYLLGFILFLVILRVIK